MVTVPLDDNLTMWPDVLAVRPILPFQAIGESRHVRLNDAHFFVSQFELP